MRNCISSKMIFCGLINYTLEQTLHAFGGGGGGSGGGRHNMVFQLVFTVSVFIPCRRGSWKFSYSPKPRKSW